MKTLWLRRYKGRDPVPVLLDDEDYVAVAQYPWCKNYHGYICGEIDGKRVYLHRLIMGFPEGKVIDHINGDKLDNRRCNLRICRHKENTRNARRSKNNTSGYTGVSYCKEREKWRADIVVDRKQIQLGRYDKIEDAVTARRQAEKRYFGEFAYSGDVG